MYKAIETVATLHGAYAAFQEAYPAIVAVWRPLRGLLMPEHFWDRGFEPRDKTGMVNEIENAHRKAKELEIKYAHYSIGDKLAIERAYRAILDTVASHRAGNREKN